MSAAKLDARVHRLDAVAGVGAGTGNQAKSPIVHIGYHKTASSWLQDVLFPVLEDVTWVGARGLAFELLHNLSNAPDERFVPFTLRRYVEEMTARHDRSVVLSYEGLSGGLWNPEDIGARAAARIAEALPDGRIVAIVREQGSMLRSIYWQYVLEGGTAPLGRLFDPASAQDAFQFSHLEYDRVISVYGQEFGPHSLLVLPYEMLRVDSDRFLERLLDFMGTSVREGESVESLLRQPRHVSPRVAAVRTVRVWNTLFRASRLSPSPRLFDLGAGRETARKLGRAVDGLTRRFAQSEPSQRDRRSILELRERYRQSNRRLQQYARWDLAAYGYVC
jgi:hypothetical protein